MAIIKRLGRPMFKRLARVIGRPAPNTAPFITLLGDALMSVMQYSQFAEPGYTATDKEDGNLNSSVTVTGSVNIEQVGSYTLTYKVKDKQGAEATATRTVMVTAILPSLAYNFASGSLAPTYGTQALSFTRASSGTYVDSTGKLVTAGVNQPRFGYDPVTKQPLGLLVEEQRTNLALYSGDFLQTPWVKNNVTAAKFAGVTPFSLTNGAWKIAETAQTNYFRLGQQFPTPIATYTISVYAKKAERDLLMFRANIGNGNWSNVCFNLTTGVVSPYTTSNPAVVVGSPTIRDFGNGWYRCSVTYNESTAGTTQSRNIFFQMVNAVPVDDNVVTYQGVEGTGLLLSAPQIETGSFSTSYIPTAEAVATRSSDILTAPITGWYNPNEGTLLAHSYFRNPVSSGVGAFALAELGDGTANNRIAVRRLLSNAKAGGIVVAGGTVRHNTSLGVGGFGAKSAVAYKVDSFAVAADGLLEQSTTGTVPTGINKLSIGSGSSSIPFSGHIKSLAYYPIRLPNSKLQELTT